MRVKITLRCNECKQRNYNTMKNKKNDPDRIELKKYCRFCKKADRAQRDEVTHRTSRKGEHHGRSEKGKLLCPHWQASQPLVP